MKLIKNTSLRLRLILVISLTALLIWTLSTLTAWWQVRKEVNNVFDAQQIFFAQRLASSNLDTILMNRHPDIRHKKALKKQAKVRFDFDHDALAFAVFTHEGERVLSDGNHGDYFNFTPTQGFSENKINDDGDDLWRIFWLPTASGRLVIAVGQELDYREDLVEEMVLSQMWIWFASLPLLILLIVWIVNRELRSLKAVSQQVEQRSPEDQGVLSTDVPKEILPLVSNLNQFFERTSHLLTRERRFTSDAAHELRSPLAGLKIQTEIAQLAGEDSQLREKALSSLTEGIDRATQLIEQLLTLSRLDNLTALDGVETVHWDKLIPSLIRERYFHAQQHQIELMYEQQSLPSPQQGQPLLLSLMLRNLVDNGIKYCPQGTTITIQLNAKGIVVEDNGGGVAPEELTKLGQRFYRPAGQNQKGCGLGLSIVQRIAQLHHYHVEIENHQNSQGEQGLRVTIHW
ncbi:two-component system sensor histidine kinase QseC [Pasteurellaceae bacterium Macca]|nr:two-component system sensor histidine kinase QseC [Pasteurellaceae bacterium Macca]